MSNFVDRFASSSPHDDEALESIDSELLDFVTGTDRLLSEVALNDEVDAPAADHQPDLKSILEDDNEPGHFPVNSIVDWDNYFQSEDDEKALCNLPESILVQDLELRC